VIQGSCSPQPDISLHCESAD